MSGLAERDRPVPVAVVPAAPVPVHEHEGDAVLDEMLDLPVDHVGVRFVVPAQDRLAVRRARPDTVPQMAVPPREEERADFVFARLDGFRRGHAIHLGKSEGRQNLGRHGHAARRHAVGRDGEAERMPPDAGVAERHAEPPLVGELSARIVVAHAVPALARADLARRREIGRIQHAAAGRQSVEGEPHVPRRRRAVVAQDQLQRKRTPRARNGELGSRVRYADIRRQVGPPQNKVQVLDGELLA